MTYPIVFIRAFVALRQVAAELLFGPKHVVTAAAGHSVPSNRASQFGHSDFRHGDDALIGGIGSTAATALILLA